MHNLTNALKNNVTSNTLGETNIEELDHLAKIFQAAAIKVSETDTMKRAVTSLSAQETEPSSRLQMMEASPRVLSTTPVTTSSKEFYITHY